MASESEQDEAEEQEEDHGKEEADEQADDEEDEDEDEDDEDLVELSSAGSIDDFAYAEMESEFSLDFAEDGEESLWA